MSDFTLLYLHGFLSSPQSGKAQQTLAYAAQMGCEENLLVPFMKDGPAETIAALTKLLQQRQIKKQDQNLGIIGSSLGGFYASVLAERYQAPAVLINPAIDPWQYWPDHIGEHKNYHTGQTHTVTDEHVEELRQLHSGSIQDPDNYLVFLQRHDEVLDTSVALSRFGEQRCIVREDGDHAYADFERELPAAFDFLLSRFRAKVR